MFSRFLITTSSVESFEWVPRDALVNFSQSRTDWSRAFKRHTLININGQNVGALLMPGNPTGRETVLSLALQIGGMALRRSSLRE
jgi:hypothetical protein